MLHKELLPLTGSLISLGFFFPQSLLPFLISLNLIFLAVGASLICDRFHLNEHLLSGQSCCTLGLFSPFSLGTLGSGFLTLSLLTLLCFSTLGLFSLLSLGSLGTDFLTLVLLTPLSLNTLGLGLGLPLPYHVH